MRTYTGIPSFAPPDYPETAATTPLRNRHLTPIVLICAAAALLLAAHRGTRPTHTDGTVASEKNAPGAAGAESSPLLSTWNLTPRQREVARLILEHHDYCDIGRLCGVSPRTVQDDASHIFREAAVKGRRDFERLMARQAQKRPASPERP